MTNLFNFEYNNNIECSFCFTITNEHIFYSKVLRSGFCLCCCDGEYDEFSIIGTNLNDIIERIPEETKEIIKSMYIHMKKHNLPMKIIDNNSIMELLTGVNICHVVCKSCDWHGPQYEFKKFCPTKTINCPHFNSCKIRVKPRKMTDLLHIHHCKKCDFQGKATHFKKHVDECVYRKVRCKDCYWFGTFNRRSDHDCVNNPSAIPKYVTEKGY